MNSVDLTSHYTNIPVKNTSTFLQLTQEKINLTHYYTNTLINIWKHITNVTCFKFNIKFYEHTYSHSIGYSHSGLLICLFLEHLESSTFKCRLLSNTTYFRYIDDILIFQPQYIKIEEIVEKVNVERSIKLTYNKESNSTILFLDILIIKSQKFSTSKLYHKPTNRNHYIHFYSQDNNKIKTGLMIGFYLRALRKCSSQCNISTWLAGVKTADVVDR